MAFLTTFEYAERCFMTVGNLSNYKKRGKCRMTGDFYDDKDPLNKMFLEARALHQAKKEQGFNVERGNRWADAEKKPKDDRPKRSVGRPPKPPIQKNDPEKKEPNFGGFVPDDLPPNKKQLPPEPNRQQYSQSDDDDGGGLQVVKMKADIARINSVRELNQLKIQKQQGELIPTELVRPVIAQLAKSLASNFKSGADNLIVEISHRKKMTGAELADLRAILVGIVNDSISKSVKDSKKMSEHIARDYTSKTAQEADEDNE